LNDFSNLLLVGMLGQQDEGHCASRVQKFGEKPSGGGSGLMFKQDQPIVSALQHRLSLFERTGVIEFRRQSAPIPFKDLPDQEKIFFPVPYQQDT
jgi:hypothetical protein